MNRTIISVFPKVSSIEEPLKKIFKRQRPSNYGNIWRPEKLRADTFPAVNTELTKTRQTNYNLQYDLIKTNTQAVCSEETLLHHYQ